MPINLDFVARRWADDGGRATERGDWGILPPALRKLAMPSIPDAPPPLMLGDMAALATERDERPIVTPPTLAILAETDRKAEDLLTRLARVEAKL